MGKKKKQNRYYHRKKDDKRQSGGFIFVAFIAFIIAAFYLWGKVQIDFVIRENDVLEQKKRELQRKVDDLRVQINRKKEYQRIVSLAKKHGMVFLSPENMAELPIDMSGLDIFLNQSGSKFQCAGIIFGKVQ
jgi:cell division protein FtsL